MVFCLGVKAPDLDWESEDEEEYFDVAADPGIAAAEGTERSRETAGDQAELEEEVNNDVSAWFESELAQQPVNSKGGSGVPPRPGRDERRRALVSGGIEGTEYAGQEGSAGGAAKARPTAGRAVAKGGRTAARDPSPEGKSIPCLADGLSPASRPFSVFIPTRIPVLRSGFSQRELDRILGLVWSRSLVAPSAVRSAENAARGTIEKAAVSSVSFTGSKRPPPRPPKNFAEHVMPSAGAADGNAGPGAEANARGNATSKKNKKRKKKKSKCAEGGGVAGENPAASLQDSPRNAADTTEAVYRRKIQVAMTGRVMLYTFR